ncbi:hypothetical Protein YC6258_01006 [Gynuella sunshinyii YC6258]|uniref:Uncharacterized protein n=2 Tax=Gynuella sunshinyii TaxID=1445505 RepID=A0A0C5VFT5_9GAMM|nr:hypothetical Protein YC6258_01006 [Gynuella sunshinyii YC6258]
MTWSQAGYAFSLFNFGGKPADHFQANAPADTVLYFDGKLSTGNNAYASEAGLAQWQQTYQELVDTIAGDSDQARFFLALLDDFVETAAQGDNAVIERYGLNSQMNMAIYMDGLLPVFQFAVKKPQNFMDTLQELEEQTGYKHEVQDLNGHAIWVWEVENKDPGLHFAVSAEKKYVTASFLFGTDSDTRKMQRLALEEDPNTLKDSKQVAELKKKYGFGDPMSGFINLVEVARTILKPEQSSAGKDLLVAFGDEYEPLVSAVCADEMIGMVQGAPRIVAGYRDFKTSKDSFKFDLTTLLEVTDEQSVTDLQKLNGHLSPAASVANGQIVSLAVGLDVANLTPVISNFWNRFVKAEFNCDVLQQAQQEAKNTNPATLSILTAMVQGLKGASMQLFDVQFDKTNQALGGIDALVALSSTSPATLVGLLANVPYLQDVHIPEDGTAVDLDIPYLPEGVKLKAAIKGNNLTVFSGDKAGKAADDLGKEKLNSNGLYSFALDYAKLSALVEDIIPVVGQQTDMEPSSCADVYMSLTGLKSVDMKLMMKQGVNQYGIFTDIQADGKTLKNAKTGQFSPGKYNVSMLDWGCEWLEFGQEEIRKDGTGFYATQDDAQQCEIFKAEYQWQKNGNVLAFTETKNVSRDSCDVPFEEVEPDGYECTIVHSSDNGFDCLFDYGDGEKAVYRYTIR